MAKGFTKRYTYMLGILIPVAFYGGIFTCQHGHGQPGNEPKIITLSQEKEQLTDKLRALEQQLKEKKAVEALRNLKQIIQNQNKVSATESKPSAATVTLRSLLKSSWSGPITLPSASGKYSLKFDSLAERSTSQKERVTYIDGTGFHSAFDQKGKTRITVKIVSSDQIPSQRL
jgi:hypothetical protein